MSVECVRVCNRVMYSSQKFFANVRRDESLLVSKAFRGGPSAKQAAEHIQQCMNTACQKVGAQQQQQQPQDHQPLS
jgi:hypothetical protein